MFYNGITKAKLFGVLGVLLLIIGLPLSLNSLKQQQITQDHAQINTSGNYDSCKRVNLTFSESPLCPILNGHGTNHINSYTFTVVVKSNDGKPHHVHFWQYNNFCTDGYKSIPCVSNPLIAEFKDKVTPFTITIQRSPTVGSYCGTYQADIKIVDIDSNAGCNYQSKSGDVAGSGFCQTGTTCSTSVTPPISCGPNGTGICSSTGTCSGTYNMPSTSNGGVCGTQYGPSGICCFKPTDTPTKAPVCTKPDVVTNVKVTFPTCQ